MDGMPNADLVFCPRCAERLEWRGVEYPDVLHPVCAAFGFILWQNVKPSVEALIIRGEGTRAEVLLGRRIADLPQVRWDAPGGFLNASDKIEQALIRECKREMSIDVKVGDLLGAYEGMFFVKVPVFAVFTVPNPYVGFSVHLRWNPSVFSLNGADATGGLFDPGASPSTGSCIGPDTSSDIDGGGVVFACTGFAQTSATGRLLVNVTLTPSASGCSALHLFTYGTPDSGGVISGTYTVNGADYSSQTNVFYDGAADVGGHPCTPGAAAPQPPSRASSNGLLVSGHCAYDLDRDGVVAILDLSIAAGAFGTSATSPKFRPWADVDGDGAISILDLSRIASDFGKPVSGCLYCRPARPDEPPGNARPVGRHRDIFARTGGVYANILNYSSYGPWVRPNNYNPSAAVAWTMLTTSDGSSLAQVGWLSLPFGRRYIFVQYTDAPNNFHPAILFDPGQPVDTSSYYTTLYDDGPARFTFQVANQTLPLTVYTYFTPTAAEVAAETQSLADQMPGGSLVPEIIADSQVFVYGWANLGGNIQNQWPQYYSVSGVSPTQTNIWDNSCAY